MLSLLQLLNSLLHCHMFNQEGEINPVKIKCSYAGKETTQMMHAKTIITSFMKWPSDGVSRSWGPQKTHWLLLARLPSQPSAPVPPFLTCLLSPMARGSPVTDTWAWSSHSCTRLMLSAPQRHCHENCSQNSWMINDRKSDYSYSSVHSFWSNDEQVSQKFWELQETREDIKCNFLHWKMRKPRPRDRPQLPSLRPSSNEEATLELKFSEAQSIVPSVLLFLPSPHILRHP